MLFGRRRRLQPARCAERNQVSAVGLCARSRRIESKMQDARRDQNRCERTGMNLAGHRCAQWMRCQPHGLAVTYQDICAHRDLDLRWLVASGGPCATSNTPLCQAEAGRSLADSSKKGSHAVKRRRVGSYICCDALSGSQRVHRTLALVCIPVTAGLNLCRRRGTSCGLEAWWWQSRCG
jgi:hypothetical protein